MCAAVDWLDTISIDSSVVDRLGLECEEVIILIVPGAADVGIGFGRSFSIVHRQVIPIFLAISISKKVEDVLCQKPGNFSVHYDCGLRMIRPLHAWQKRQKHIQSVFSDKLRQLKKGHPNLLNHKKAIGSLLLIKWHKYATAVLGFYGFTIADSQLLILFDFLKVVKSGFHSEIFCRLNQVSAFDLKNLFPIPVVFCQ